MNRSLTIYESAPDEPDLAESDCRAGHVRKIQENSSMADGKGWHENNSHRGCVIVIYNTALAKTTEQGSTFHDGCGKFGLIANNQTMGTVVKHKWIIFVERITP